MINVYVIGQYKWTGLLDAFVERIKIEIGDLLRPHDERKSVVKYYEQNHKHVILTEFNDIDSLFNEETLKKCDILVLAYES